MLNENFHFGEDGAHYLQEILLDDEFYQKINFKNYEKDEEYTRYSQRSIQTECLKRFNEGFKVEIAVDIETFFAAEITVDIETEIAVEIATDIETFTQLKRFSSSLLFLIN